MANHKWACPDGFTDRLRQAMHSRAITGEEMALELNVSPSTIYGYLIHKSCMNIVRLCEICDILDISADWLLYGKGNMERC